MRSFCGVTIGNAWLRDNPDLVYPINHQLMSDAELEKKIRVQPTNEELTLLKIESELFKAREHVSKKFQLNMHFVNYCDVVCDLLANNLTILGLDITIVSGVYRHQYPNSTIDDYGHCWLTIPSLELLLDPTRCQFDNSTFIFDINDLKETENYQYPPEEL